MSCLQDVDHEVRIDSLSEVWNAARYDCIPKDIA